MFLEKHIIIVVDIDARFKVLMDNICRKRGQTLINIFSSISCVNHILSTHKFLYSKHILGA